MSKTRKKMTPFKLIVIALTVVLAVLVFVFVLRFAYASRTYPYEYSYLQDNVDDNDYPSLVYGLSRNEALGETLQKDTAQFSLLAQYYEKAVLYKAYSGSGEAEKAAKLLEELTLLEEQITDIDAADGVSYLKETYVR